MNMSTFLKLSTISLSAQIIIIYSILILSGQKIFL